MIQLMLLTITLMKLTETYCDHRPSSSPIKNGKLLGKLKFDVHHQSGTLKAKCLIFYSIDYSQYFFRIIASSHLGIIPLYDYVILLTPNIDLYTTYWRCATDILTVATQTFIKNLRMIILNNVIDVIGDLILEYLLF